MIDNYTQKRPRPADYGRVHGKRLGWEAAYTYKRETFGTESLEGYALEPGDGSMNGGTGDSNG